jgi:endonuclease/exonuclease/phosphatase family metal-dependent hydrolase
MGLDGQLSMPRIARVLAECDADVIALQELDVQNSRTGFSDQAVELGKLVGMDVHFHPAFSIATEHYGDAVLSRLPVRLVRASGLPTDPSGRGVEPRGALWVAVDCGGWELQVINTHLGLRPLERLAQIESLLGPGWIGNPQCRGPVVLCGDFNAGPTSLVYRRITDRLRDAQRALKGFRPRHTWCSPFPLLRIDHVFVNAELDVAGVNVPVSSMIRTASDHLPLVVDLAAVPVERVVPKSEPVAGQAR